MILLDYKEESNLCNYKILIITISYRCVPAADLTAAVAPALALENEIRQKDATLKAAGIHINLNEPGGGHLSNADLPAAQRARYAEANNYIRYLQLLQGRVSLNQGANIMTRAQFLEWVNDQYGCPITNTNSLCTQISIGSCPAQE